jgi:hypothetical protein
MLCVQMQASSTKGQHDAGAKVDGGLTLQQFDIHPRPTEQRQVDSRQMIAGMNIDRGRIPPKPDLLCTDVDYKGVVYGTQLAIHFMRKNKRPGGKIVATASVAGVVPHESYPEYDGAKAAVSKSA